jgi:hypothetical protein
VAVGLGRLGRLPGDGTALFVADGFGFGLALFVADGFGFGLALLVADGFGDGVALPVADGVAVGVADGVGVGSAVGVAVGVADAVAVGEADGEGLGAADALTGRMRAPPAVRTPTTVRTAVRAPTSIGRSKASYPDRQYEQGLNGPILLEPVKRGSDLPQPLGVRVCRRRLPGPGILDACRACMKPQAVWRAWSGWPGRGIAG